MVQRRIQDRDDIGAVQRGLLSDEIRYALSDLPIDLGLQRLRASQTELGPQRLLAGRDLEIDLRSDPERLELPRLERSGHEGREIVVPIGEALANPARALRDPRDLSHRMAPSLIREPVAEFPEEAAEA